MSALECIPQGHRVTVWLNRPEQHNAFDADLIALLTEAFQTIPQDPQVRVMVLAARGGTFCAGADLRWMRAMADQDHAANLSDARLLAQLLWSVAHCPVPVIAQVQGDCMGGGVGLVAACDIAVSTAHAHFALSEVKLGLIPATISPYLVRAMGPRQALRHALTAERINARQALDCGLLHEVHEPMDLMPRVDELAQAMAGHGPQAMRQTKQLMLDVAGQPLDAALLEETARRIADVRASDEGRAGLQAFLNRQSPPWHDTP